LGLINEKQCSEPQTHLEPNAPWDVHVTVQYEAGTTQPSGKEDYLLEAWKKTTTTTTNDYEVRRPAGLRQTARAVRSA
jgi:hypothetical protein